jgi:SAM-dependent methyltransferase
VPCGGGRDAAAIGAQTAVLVDPDPHARAVAAAHNPDAVVVDATLETLPEGTFDLILFVGLAEYLDDATLGRGLVELRERLADGGALICTTTAQNADQGRMGTLFGWETRARALADLKRVLDTAGFWIEAERGDPLGIQWLVVARPIATPVG